jgi:hypothetical protein
MYEKDLIKIDEVNVNDCGSLFLIKTHLKPPRSNQTVLKMKLSSERNEKLWTAVKILRRISIQRKSSKILSKLINIQNRHPFEDIIISCFFLLQIQFIVDA